MSSEIYIPLTVVLSHPGQFELKAALNVDTNSAYAEIIEDDTDWDYVRSCLEPVLLCKFGAREAWHCVEVFTTKAVIQDNGHVSKSELSLHICCGVSFFSRLCFWLNEHNYKYSTLVDSDYQTYNQR